MEIDSRTTIQLGELIAAAFDEAARRHSGDPRQVTRVATGIVFDALRRARRPLPRGHRPARPRWDLERAPAPQTDDD